MFPKGHPEPARFRCGAGLAAALLFACLPVFLTGCAMSSAFRGYPSRISPLLSAVRHRSPVNLESAIGLKARGRDAVLYNMERGRIAQIQGDIDGSMAAFREAMARIREQDEAAVLRASGAAQQVGATMLNDNALPYRGKGYERVMLHHYQAINYLLKGDLEGCGVEIRRANHEQNEALKRHNKEIAKAKQEADERRLNTSVLSNRLSRAYAGMDEVAGMVKNSFQNAATFYLSGVCYELLGQDGDAYIDYKKALEIMTGNRYVQMAALRLARQLGMTEEAAELVKRFPQAAARLRSPPPAGAGELIVFFEDEFVPPKKQIKIPIPLPGATSATFVAFPYYETSRTLPKRLRVDAEAFPSGQTEPVCYMGALAVKALNEDLPQLVLRQALRATAKGVMAKAASDRAGSLAGLLSGFFNYVTESADLRSWNSLPRDVQILRMHVSSGTRRLRLTHPSSGAETETEVHVPAGGKTLVFVLRAGQSLYVSRAAFDARGSAVTAGNAGIPASIPVSLLEDQARTSRRKQ